MNPIQKIQDHLFNVAIEDGRTTMWLDEDIELSPGVTISVNVNATAKLNDDDEIRGYHFDFESILIMIGDHEFPTSSRLESFNFFREYREDRTTDAEKFDLGRDRI